MTRRVEAGVAVGIALLLAVAATALATKPFLPKRAHYKGRTEHGGTLAFKVRHHRVVYISGSLPLRRGGTCQFASKHRMPLRLYNSQPVGNGPFTITATQHATNKDNNWRVLRFHASGQFDPSATRATGTLRARLHDREGHCRTRKLDWHIRRR